MELNPNFVRAALVVTIATSLAVPSGESWANPAKPSKCLKFSGWSGRADDVDKRQYINTASGRTLLEFQAPGDEDVNGPVPAESTVFGGSFPGLKAGKRYRLRTSISVERSDEPYVFSVSGVQTAPPNYRMSVPSTKGANINIVVTATSSTALLFWQARGHNKMWAFVSEPTLCAI